MIKIIRHNKNNKVIGLEINGTRHSLSRDICHALHLEELKSHAQSKAIEKKLSSIKGISSSKSYCGSSNDLSLEVQFDELGRIESSKTKVEFKKAINQKMKDNHILLLEGFILSVNRALYKRSLDLTREVNKFKKDIDAA